MRNIIAVLFGIIIIVTSSIGAGADTGLARHKKMFVVPAPGKVTIDGRLDDWDLSAQISMYVVSETSDMQGAKFALMYDKQNLYLSGVVRDPSPMMNKHDPKIDADKAWDGDACQVRLTLDPGMGYPVNIGYGAGEMSNSQIVHMTLWNYTDREEPCLEIQRTMNFQPGRPAWGPFGVVPHQDFEAKYAKMADGRGYTFEYAIPWTTLGAKAPLKAGDLVAGTVQFNWSSPDGLHTAGNSAWAYDVMNGPGFPYQSTISWGKLIFASKGHIAKNLVEQGIVPPKPLPLKFTYDVPEDSQITIQLEDKSGMVRRILVAQGNRQAGKNVELWDGMDYQGKPLAAGQYTWRGIYHKPLSTKFLFSPENSGTPPYKTDDGTGAWGGDEGDPQAIAALDDGIIMVWQAAESGSGIIRTDLNGRKVWGTLHAGRLVSTDGQRLFVAGDNFFSNGEGIALLAAKDSRPIQFTNGKSVLEAPAGGASDTNIVTGLAYGNGTVYVSYQKRNLIAVYDAQSGAMKDTWSISSPACIATTPTGGIIGESDGTVVRLDGGKATSFAASHVDDPRGIAVGGDGTVYVANGGKLMNISVFDASGNFVRSIGKLGGRPLVGTYDPSGMLEPGGIAIDKNGHLWVPEKLDGPRRISEWDAKSGDLVNEFFGGASYFGYSFIDPAKPDEIYCHNVLWKIDWSNNTCKPVSTIWRKTEADMMPPPGPNGYSDHPRYFTATNGKQYSYGGENFLTVLSKRDGSLYKPFCAFIAVVRGYAAYGDKTQFASMDDAVKFPNGEYFWEDLNNDQKVQADELTFIGTLADKVKASKGHWVINAIDDHLNIWLMNGYVMRPTRWDGDRPIYDPNTAEASFLIANGHNENQSWLDPIDGGVYTLDSQLSKWSADGKMVWAFPGTVPWGNSLNMPMQAPGTLNGLTNPLGVAGDFTGCSDYFGPYHLWTRDGVYVGMIMRDGRDGKGFGPDITASEVLTGQLVKPEGTNRYFLLAGASDARVTEIFGLDTVKPLQGGEITLTDADVKTASDALDAYNADRSRSSTLSIARGSGALAVAEPVSKTLDSNRGFSVRAAYDADNLYLSYEVTSPNELINAESDPALLFKGGNVLDIQLASDPVADPKRTVPAPGDIRILVTRQATDNGGPPVPLAVVYRPRVAGFTGSPRILKSPMGQESFDAIETTDKVKLSYQKTGTGYNALVTIPQRLVGLSLKPGRQLKIDVGVIYGNSTGNEAAARSYWMNNSATANILHDVPNEARLEPSQWGIASVE